jgi:uncharacterized protein
MTDVIRYLITLIVDHPEDVAVSESEVGTGSFLYSITAHQDDYGKIIGKDGKIISALRTILKVLAVKQGSHIRLEIANTTVVPS